MTSKTNWGQIQQHMSSTELIPVTRRFEFDAGHRLLNHEGKCKHLHGHRYVADVTVAATELDSVGRVIDFGSLKQLIGGWIDAQWDHNMILHQDDPLAKMWSGLVAVQEQIRSITKPIEEIFQGRAPYTMPFNPTAENIAKCLYKVAIELVKEPIIVVNVKVWETPNCSAGPYPYEPIIALE